MQEQLVAVNGSGGAYVSVPAPMFTRMFTVREDEAGTPQGLTYQLPDDNFVNTYTVGTPGSPDQPQITRGHVSMTGNAMAPLLGLPTQTGLQARAADTLIKLRSKTVTATSVRIVFYD